MLKLHGKPICLRPVQEFVDDINSNATLQISSVGRQPCVEAQFIVAQMISGDYAYTRKARSSLAEFRAEFWDSKENDYLRGSGGTLPYKYMAHLIEDDFEMQVINSTDSAYFVYLLSLYEGLSQ